MANPVQIPGDLIVPGNLRLTGGITPTKARSQFISVSDLQHFFIPWTWWRTWDSFHTNLPGTAADDDLALIGGTFGTDPPCIQGQDFGGTSATGYARCVIPLPWEYVAGADVNLRFHAGMLTTIADDSCTLDVVCYKSDEELDLSADLCATSVQSINSTSFADIDFTITATTFNPGDQLDVQITIAGTDAGDAGAGITGTIGAAWLLCDVR